MSGIEMSQMTFHSSRSYPLDNVGGGGGYASTSTQTSSSSVFLSPAPSTSTIVLQPPPPSPSTPPLPRYPRFQSTGSMPIASFDDDDELDPEDPDDHYDTLPPPPYRFPEAELDFIDSPPSRVDHSQSALELNNLTQSYQPPQYHPAMDPPTPTPYALLQLKKLNARRQSSPHILPVTISAVVTASGSSVPDSPITPTGTMPTLKNRETTEKRIGHRRVNLDGQVTYKRIKSTQIMYSIQLGIGYSVGSLASKPERDLLMHDFMQIETVHFPKSGSPTTPAHHYTDFTFSTYTPFAFRYFRELFRIQPDDFMLSITNDPLQELSNPGASGSVFYRTKDDQFIIKTVERNEAKFLLKLLAGYYMNLSQNPHTLLPRFFGLYCYECIGKNIRILVMNNILPSYIKIHQKYDLKGSSFKRKASPEELKMSTPTFKDLDFIEHYYSDEDRALMNHFSRVLDHSNSAANGNGNVEARPAFPSEGGLLLEAHVYDELIETLQRDCRVLESFEIMDYSLLVGVHNYDQSHRDNPSNGQIGGSDSHSRYYDFDYDNDDNLPPGAIRAMNRKGERLLLFVGIIDILQSYRLVKKVEHTWKALFYDGDTISVHRPKFYAKRFLDFMSKKVFGRIPAQAPQNSESSYYRYKAMRLRKRFSRFL